MNLLLSVVIISMVPAMPPSAESRSLVVLPSPLPPVDSMSLAKKMSPVVEVILTLPPLPPFSPPPKNELSLPSPPFALILSVTVISETESKVMLPAFVPALLFDPSPPPESNLSASSVPLVASM